MADDKGKGKETEKKEEPKEKSGSGMRTLIAVVVVMLIGIVAAALSFRFIIYPILQPHSPAGAEGSGGEGSEKSTEAESGEKIPAKAVTVTFDDGFANVIMPEAGMPASLLLYQVSFLVSDPETAELITKNKPVFEDIITTLHSYRTRDELNDPMVKKSIQKQVLELSNEKLRQMQPKPEPEKRIISVLHNRFAINE